MAYYDDTIALLQDLLTTTIARNEYEVNPEGTKKIRYGRPKSLDECLEDMLLEYPEDRPDCFAKMLRDATMLRDAARRMFD